MSKKQQQAGLNLNKLYRYCCGDGVSNELGRCLHESCLVGCCTARSIRDFVFSDCMVNVGLESTWREFECQSARCTVPEAEVSLRVVSISQSSTSTSNPHSPHTLF